MPNVYPSAVHMANQLRPGARFWATCLEVSTPPTKIVKRMPPTLVEITCGGKTPEVETERRKNPGHYVYSLQAAPVKADGSIDFRKAVRTYGVSFFTDEDDAKRAYAELVDEATKTIDEAIGVMQALKEKIQKA